MRIFILFIICNSLIAQKESIDTTFYVNKNIKTIRYLRDYHFDDHSIKREFRPSKNLSKIKDSIFYYDGGHLKEFRFPIGFRYFYNDSAYGGINRYYGEGFKTFSATYGFPYFSNLTLFLNYNISDTLINTFSISTDDSLSGKVRDFITSMKFDKKKGVKFGNIQNNPQPNWFNLGAYGSLYLDFYPTNFIKTIYLEYKKNGATNNVKLELREDFSIEKYTVISKSTIEMGYTKCYLKNGYLESEGGLLGVTKNGIWKYYDENERLLKTENWVNGKIIIPEIKKKVKKKSK